MALSQRRSDIFNTEVIYMVLHNPGYFIAGIFRITFQLRTIVACEADSQAAQFDLLTITDHSKRNGIGICLGKYKKSLNHTCNFMYKSEW